MSHRATIKPLVLILINFYFKNLYVLKKCRYEIFCFIAFSRHKPANGRLSKIRSENIPKSIVSCFVKSFIPLNFAENDFPQIRYRATYWWCVDPSTKISIKAQVPLCKPLPALQLKNVLYPSVRSILYVAIFRFFSQDILKFNVVFTVQDWDIFAHVNCLKRLFSPLDHIKRKPFISKISLYYNRL